MSVRLQMSGIQKRFGATRALADVTLQVQEGEVHALVGENGAGKSTLMKVLSGAHRPDEGRMELEGQLYQPASPLAARQAGIAMLYQEGSLLPHLSLEENLFLGQEECRYGFRRQQIMRRRSLDALERVGLSELDPNMSAAKLSPAQAQLVELARAFVSGCRLLVLDEPTSSLSRRDVEKLFSLIRSWRQEGMSIIYISHFLEEIESLADQVTVLCDGRSVETRPLAEWTRQDIIRCMVGRDVSQLYPDLAPPQEDCVLEWSSGEEHLQLRRGEILGISGLIGSGRSEFLEALFGLRQGPEAELGIQGHAGYASPRQRWQNGMGFLSEDRKERGLALQLSISDNLWLSSLPRWSSPKRRRSEAEIQVQRLKIRCPSAELKVSGLSGGNQQKVALGRLLQHGCDLLLLDEPTRGIDVGAKSDIYHQLRDLAAGAGGQPPCAILLVSSYLPELLGLCHRIAVMREGQLGEAQPREQWSEHSLLEASLS